MNAPDEKLAMPSSAPVVPDPSEPVKVVENVEIAKDQTTKSDQEQTAVEKPQQPQTQPGLANYFVDNPES